MFFMSFGLNSDMHYKCVPLFYTPLFLISLIGHAQSVPRFAISSGWGNNIGWTATSSSPAISWNNRISFTPHYAFMVDFELETGALGGEEVNKQDNTILTEKFTSNYTYKGAVLNVNVKKLFKPGHKPSGVVPYIYAGFGFLDFETVKYVNGGAVPVKRYKYSVYTNRVGVKFRFKINDYLDWLVVAETTLPQTYYLDANPNMNSYDKFSSARLELCYKINCKPKTEYIEWQAKTCKLACAGRFY